MTQSNTATSKELHTLSAAEAGSLPGLFKWRTEQTPNHPAYQQYDKKQNSWVTYSWQEMGDLVARWQQGLKKEALAPGDRVALLLANSIEWVCFEQAALGLGLVVVPLYTWDSPDNIAYLLKDSGSSLLLTGTADQWQQLIPHAASLRKLTKVICLEEKTLAEADAVATASVHDWLPDDGGTLSIHTADLHSLATIVYTSGTTGPPKGVMLSHSNILCNAEAILKVVPTYASDILLSFLPLSHTFERTVGYYTPMMAGASVAYTRSIEELGEDLRTIRPTIIISVPRIFEKVYTKIQNQLQQKSGLARWLFQLTLDTGWHHFEASQGRTSASSFRDTFLHPLLQHIVAAKVLNRLGGRIRLAVSGGAPLNEAVSRFFLSIGLPLLQGYGLTEVAPVVSTNSLDNNIPASVGPPLPGIKCRTGADKELLVKSPGLMSGYWNLPEMSKEAIDSEGWLHTGDIVEIINGNIHIRGRLKEIIVTSTGEKIPPADLEMTIVSDPLVDHAMVIGEGMPYLAALLVLHPSEWQELAAKWGLAPDDPSTLHAPEITKAIIEKLEHLLHEFPGNARIRTVALLLDQWSIANGILTPTLKLKRGIIRSRYAEIIKELYKGHEVPS